VCLQQSILVVVIAENVLIYSALDTWTNPNLFKDRCQPLELLSKNLNYTV